MKSMSMTETTILLELQLIRCSSPVFSCCVIPSFALATRKDNNLSHLFILSSIILPPKGRGQLIQEYHL